MFQELKLVFQTHACVERYETSDKDFAYSMEENSLASEHVLRMSRHYNRLNQVGVNLPDNIVIDSVLCWKYDLEAIIKWLLLYFFVHDNCLLFML